MRNENSGMSAKKLCVLAVLICFAAALSALETMLPPICPIAGVRVGLGNVVTLFMLFADCKNKLLRGIRFKGGDVLAVAVLRCFLAALITGALTNAIYGLAGGLLSCGAMLLARRISDKIPPPFVGIIGAVSHIAGQLTVAVVMYGTMSILAYTPILLASAIIGGAFTGICTKLILKIFH